MHEMDEKRLRDILNKVKEGKITLCESPVKNIQRKKLAGCAIDKKFKPYRMKTGEELLVDKELDLNLLDKMNSNKNIDIETVCSGHGKDLPTIGFNYKGKLPIRDIKNILTTIPGTKITYDDQLVKTAIPIKGESKIKMDDKEFTLCSIKNIRQDYFFIRGTRKGNNKWWSNVSNTLSKLE